MLKRIRDSLNYRLELEQLRRGLIGAFPRDIWVGNED